MILDPSVEQSNIPDDRLYFVETLPSNLNNNNNRLANHQELAPGGPGVDGSSPGQCPYVIQRPIHRRIQEYYNNIYITDADVFSWKKDNLKNSDMALNERLKEMGWYWGSISPEFASALLQDTQDGTFLIRDSSSECFIFSMTFKLDNRIHHTRIEHSSNYFSFGRSRKFYLPTMWQFIEAAITCSRNGDLSFFLHRGPELEGPVEFRMIPFSRMSCSQSLKHLCRFAILPYVRKDKISELNLPECLKDYLQEPFRGS